MPILGDRPCLWLGLGVAQALRQMRLSHGELSQEEHGHSQPGISLHQERGVIEALGHAEALCPQLLGPLELPTPLGKPAQPLQDPKVLYKRAVLGTERLRPGISLAHLGCCSTVCGSQHQAEGEGAL